MEIENGWSIKPLGLYSTRDANVVLYRTYGKDYSPLSDGPFPFFDNC